MVTGHDDLWAGMGWDGWEDHIGVRRRLERGADPEAWSGGRPLHRAAAFGSPEVVTELARRVADVDAPENGTTALWEAVLYDRPDNARALAAAGADPWRPVLAGWSPGRLSLAGPAPDLFAVPDTERGPSGAERGLSAAERTAVREARRLAAALDGIHYEGTGLACVAGIDAEEAVRRLAAAPAGPEEVAELLEEPWAYDPDESLRIVGVTTVPGGCIVTQPWGYTPAGQDVLTRLSTGTVCYGLYANPKSGNQGSIVRDGTVEGSDLHPGGGPDLDDTPGDVLTAYLYRHSPVAYACAFAGLRPADARAVVGNPDLWVELPRRDPRGH
uniref:Ankyrin repeat domain-containing protein n=1 Tax=Streptomyces sp. NBC_00049 TaxID=2903617 RepID=A0AAU2JVV0_9ACTN